MEVLELGRLEVCNCLSTILIDEDKRCTMDM